MAVRKTRPTLSNLERRLSKVRVLVADRDARTASLVNGVLRSFGFQAVELATDVEHVMEALQNKPFGLIITEWQLASSDGIHLVKSIRGAEKGSVRRDIPIIMLTAHSDVDAVKRARDAGITEFLAKPFSAQTMSDRLIQVIDHPRSFIEADAYIGPCRRRRGDPPPGEGERRGARKKPKAEWPPNRELAEVIGKDISATDIFTDRLIKKAQSDLQKQETQFVQWARDDIGKLEKAFAEINKNPNSTTARDAILQAAYAIKSQAGIFGYDLGTQVAGSLVDYLEAHARIGADQLTVLHKHIETIRVVFNHKIKESGGTIGTELLASLQKLVKKLG